MLSLQLKIFCLSCWRGGQVERNDGSAPLPLWSISPSPKQQAVPPRLVWPLPKLFPACSGCLSAATQLSGTSKSHPASPVCVVVHTVHSDTSWPPVLGWRKITDSSAHNFTSNYFYRPEYEGSLSYICLQVLMYHAFILKVQQEASAFKISLNS